MVLTVLGMVAEMELGFIRDRQRAGIDAAKAKGIYKAAPSLSTAHASCRYAKTEWALGRRVQAGKCVQGAQGGEAELSGFGSSDAPWPTGSGPLRRRTS